MVIQNQEELINYCCFSTPIKRGYLHHGIEMAFLTRKFNQRRTLNGIENRKSNHSEMARNATEGSKL